MKERLREYALFAEIISGVAILVTLIFLIIEVKDNSAVIQATAYGQSMEMLNQWRLVTANNQELSHLWNEFENGNVGSFDEDEFQQYLFLNTTLWGIYENAYFSTELNIMGEQEWSRFFKNACNQYTSILNNEGWGQFKTYLTEQFSIFIENECN